MLLKKKKKKLWTRQDSSFCISNASDLYRVLCSSRQLKILLCFYKKGVAALPPLISIFFSLFPSHSFSSCFLCTPLSFASEHTVHPLFLIYFHLLSFPLIFLTEIGNLNCIQKGQHSLASFRYQLFFLKSTLISISLSSLSCDSCVEPAFSPITCSLSFLFF